MADFLSAHSVAKLFDFGRSGSGKQIGGDECIKSHLPNMAVMFNTSQFTGNNLEVLVRTALIHGELSPGVAKAINYYRAKPSLTAVEQRQLEILDSAIADASVVSVQPPIPYGRMQVFA